MSTKLSENKRALIGQLITEYNIKDGKDLQEALKDLLGGTIQEMLETELDEELGYEKNERTESNKENYRNGYKAKTVKTGMAGEIELAIPQERKGEFEPKIVPKYSRDISGIEQKIINMYGRGLTTREISEQIEDIYGFEASADLISKVTDRIMPQIEEWQSRTLSETYPIIFIDAIIFNVRKERIVGKKAVYVVLGINSEGMKEVLSIEMGDVESSIRVRINFSVKLGNIFFVLTMRITVICYFCRKSKCLFRRTIGKITVMEARCQDIRTKIFFFLNYQFYRKYYTSSKILVRCIE